MTLVERINHLLRRRSRAEERRIAREADQWLNDETLNMALALMRRKAMEKWAESPDVRVQRECWRALRAIDSFTRALKGFIEADKHETAKEDRRDRRESVS